MRLAQLKVATYEEQMEIYCSVQIAEGNGLKFVRRMAYMKRLQVKEIYGYY